jgi:hypothetical protein
MHYRWSCLVLALAFAGCGTEDDDRPLTLEGVTLTVLAPSCGQTQCHSTATRTEGFAFDTVEASRESLGDLVFKPEPLGSELWGVITAEGYQRMPPDAPLLSTDIEYIRQWLLAGAPGL